MPAAFCDESSRDPEDDWLLGRLHTLQARILTANLKLPPAFRQKLEALDVNECNSSGESLLIAAVKQLESPIDRQKYVGLLLQAGADVNAADHRERRTALMYACIEENRFETGSLILKAKGLNLQKQDRLGNTAVMYAAMKGREELLSEMVDFISKMKNCMGNTAEELAIRNEHHRCARMVQSQMDMVGKVGSRQWCAFAAVYRCIDKWKPKQRRRSEERAAREGKNGRKRKKSL